VVSFDGTTRFLHRRGKHAKPGQTASVLYVPHDLRHTRLVDWYSSTHNVTWRKVAAERELAADFFTVCT
jgi:hypothetical protein